MRIGSLFSGIGGLELGLEWAGLGPVVWQCEIDPFCRRVLAKHWPNAERFEDVRGLMPPPVDVLCGGFPCQDVSSGNHNAAGLAGERSGLWREYRRIVEAIKPAIVVVENVASGARRWLPHVRRDLHVLGYRTRAYALSAADVGAPFQRRRVFVVAHADREGKPSQSVDAEMGCAPTLASVRNASDADGVELREQHGRSGRTCRAAPPIAPFAGWWPAQPEMVRVVSGVSGGVVRALGNAVVPQCAEVIGRIILEAA